MKQIAFRYFKVENNYIYKITFTFNDKDGTKTVPLAECDSSSVGSDTYSFGPPLRYESPAQKKTHPFWVCLFGLYDINKFYALGAASESPTTLSTGTENAIP